MSDANIKTTLRDISRRAFMDEPEAMRILLDHVEKLSVMEKPIMERASTWTNHIRNKGIGHGVEAFLNAYGLDTNEGVALMCLAEALLRIPDGSTADAMIHDTFEGRNWADYTEKNDSWLVNLSSWGLLLTGKVVDFGQDPKVGARKVITNLVTKTGDPIIREVLRKAMQIIGRQFVLGESIEQALGNSRSDLKQGYRFSYDLLGEGARSNDQAQEYIQAYDNAVTKIGESITTGTSLFDAPSISVKLSALHARYQFTQRNRVIHEILPSITKIMINARQAGITATIDAEEASRLDIELILLEQLMADAHFKGWDGIGFVIQAYQKRAFYLVDWLANLARKHRRIIPVRLVKGAYWDSEIKWAQIEGLPSYPVFTRKAHTDVSYLACAEKILRHPDVFYPQFATHNARTMASIMHVASEYGWHNNAYEFQRLHGMGEALHDLVKKEVASRIYAPVGAHKDLLAYLIRRLLENGANSSFVRLLMDHSQSTEDILADPVTITKSHEVFMNTDIPLPENIYGDARKNSAGIDFGNAEQVETLTAAVNSYAQKPLASVKDDSLSTLKNAIRESKKAFADWSATDANERSSMLNRMAELLEHNQEELIAICCVEAGKTLADAVAEIREAIDFCRYYAKEMENLSKGQSLASPAGESNTLSLHPRGVFGCISPWNFPLAIFIGQVTAALVTGNCVIAKPAAQTPRIARRAVELLYEAGIPKDVLHLVIGGGATIGSALVANPQMDGIVFTGSVNTAHSIHRSLADRGGPIVPLIAETGGQNCMVVDSSALPEQAIDDIILSAFGSAGQRCSALRIVFVQDNIADDLLELLAGAMQELTIGNPLDPSTDIGPVIDAAAQSMLLTHIEQMKQSAKLIASTPLPDLQGHYVAPHAFEIHHISDLSHEVFGPVLHVIRFKTGSLQKVIEDINSTGYGLTFGIHSRVDNNIQLLASKVRAGNIYVNRTMIGATVGVQPFGGEGLSGTGPKAGGPYYLLRFLTERTTTINTAAIGGNVSLLAS